MMLPNPTLYEISHVCRNLREQSRREVLNATDLDPDQYAQLMHIAEGPKYIGYADGKPAAYLAATLLHGGVWGFTGFGTDDWSKIWRSVTKTALTRLFPTVKAAGWHRAQCMTLADSHDVHRWLEFLGATQECVIRSYGKGGQDYIMFAWHKD